MVALLLATGYLLKLSFERGWISPVLRCVGGALLGAVVGAIGWRLVYAGAAGLKRCCAAVRPERTRL